MPGATLRVTRPARRGALREGATTRRFDLRCIIAAIFMAALEKAQRGQSEAALPRHAWVKI